MVLTLDALAGQGMPENAFSYDGPIDVIGGARHIASAIQDAVRGGKSLQS